MSYKVEVDTGEVTRQGEVHWSSNAIRLATEEEAKKYGRNLASRWTLVVDWRVAESEDSVNYRWNEGKLESI